MTETILAKKLNRTFLEEYFNICSKSLEITPSNQNQKENVQILSNVI